MVKVINAKEEGEGWLSIRKYIAGTTIHLSGVLFRITSDAGYDRTFTTDNTGNIYITVPEGTYKVQEVRSIPDYQMDSSVKTITVERGKFAQDIVFYNASTNATLAITKVDADTASPLSGAKFGAGDTLVVTLITDSSARASTVLPYGDYILRELEGPSEYVLDIKSSVTFTIDSSRSFVEMTITNNKIPVVIALPKSGFGENNFIVVIPMLLLSIISGIDLIVLNRTTIRRFVKKYRHP